MTEIMEKVLKDLGNNYKPNTPSEIKSLDGWIYNVVCDYNPPATKEDLESLEKYADTTIPDDYAVFLNSFNGARLLATYEDGKIIKSDGLEIFDVENAIDNSKNLDLESNYIAVGIFLDDYWIVLDLDKNCICICEYGEMTESNIRFEQFVDKFMKTSRHAFWQD
ncbi:hypothetical protein HB943_14675 [Listeria weihenstephanensis]|uniref:Knr4/Smi1-like domain-containing protein n=1 Tax=Listeria weihenstephanensis TaxID=1006155 RepID=A0A841ZC38_9LIST|nr:SMI1/KNR4 family protein [Listeria weihenstephanensis]MBC1501843.1 hypothetical protein [Listeria weihenstephanensis]